MFFVGIDVAKDVSMVKRASSYLRWTLLTTARTLAMRDPCFKSYYPKKEQNNLLAQS